MQTVPTICLRSTHHLQIDTFSYQNIKWSLAVALQLALKCRREERAQRLAEPQRLNGLHAKEPRQGRAEGQMDRCAAAPWSVMTAFWSQA